MKGRTIYCISTLMLYLILFLEPQEHEAICLSLCCSADVVLTLDELGMLDEILPKKRDGPEEPKQKSSCE